VLLGQWAQGSGTFALNGGVLETPVVRTDAVGGGYGCLYLNGGTLKAAADTTNFVYAESGDVMNIYVGAHGADIDTNGFNVYLDTYLQRDPALGLSGADGGFTKSGAGTLSMNTNNQFTGPTNINGGTLVFNLFQCIQSASSINVNNGAGLILGASSGLTVSGVHLNNGSIVGPASAPLTSTSTFDVQNGSVSAVLNGTVGLTKSTSGVVTLTGANTYTGVTTVTGGALALGPAAWSAVLTGTGHADIQKGMMQFVYGTGTDPLSTTIYPALVASYNGGVGSWTTGLFQSSTALANGTTLGWIDNTTSEPIVSGSNVFPADCVTVIATMPGDFNLDGAVDFADVDIWKSNLGVSGATWIMGDGTYDGSVDFADVDLWKANLGGSFDTGASAAASSGVGSPVPEPGTLALLLPVLALFGYVVARRRSK
jgi:autotransporter-associated beta strand protein